MESQVRGSSKPFVMQTMAFNMVNTAEGAMDEITNMLQRMRELAIQSKRTQYQDRQNLDAEVQQLKSEIDRVASQTPSTTRKSRWVLRIQTLADWAEAGKSLSPWLCPARLGTCRNGFLEPPPASGRVTASGYEQEFSPLTRTPSREERLVHDYALTVTTPRRFEPTTD